MDLLQDNCTISLATLITTNVITFGALIFALSRLSGKRKRCQCCQGNGYSSNCKTTPTLNRNYVRDLITNYAKGQAEIIGAAWNADNTTDATLVDARSAWFELEELKAFINTIETYTTKMYNSQNLPPLGIRIYYGAYPDASDFNTTLPYNTDDNNNSLLTDFKNNSSKTLPQLGKNTDYSNLHTLVMIPTFYDTNTNLNIDFNPADSSPTSLLAIDTIKSDPLNPTKGIVALNLASLEPPPFKGNLTNAKSLAVSNDALMGAIADTQ